MSSEVTISIDTMSLESEIEGNIDAAMENVEIPSVRDIEEAIRDQIDMDEVVAQAIEDLRDEVRNRLREQMLMQLGKVLHEGTRAGVLEMSRRLGVAWEEMGRKPRTDLNDDTKEVQG
jgi:hypothetical protein